MVTVCTVQLSLYCAVLHCTALYTARSVCHSNQLENTAAASNNYCSYNYNNNNSSSEEDNTVRWQQWPQQQWCCYQGCEGLAEDCAIILQLASTSVICEHYWPLGQLTECTSPGHTNTDISTPFFVNCGPVTLSSCGRAEKYGPTRR